MKKYLILLLVAISLGIAGMANATTYYEAYTGTQYMSSGDQYNFGFDFWYLDGVGDNSALVRTADASGAFGVYNPVKLFIDIYSTDQEHEQLGVRVTIWNEDQQQAGAFSLPTQYFDLDGSPSWGYFSYTFTTAQAALFDDWGWGNVRVKAENVCGNDFDLKRVAMEVTTADAVPEPMTMLLLGLGLTGVAGLRRKFKK